MSSTNDNDVSASLEFENLSERNQQTLSDIQGLQTVEKGLFSALEAGLANNSLTPEKRQAMIDQINNVSSMRVNLYKNLNGMYGFFQRNMDSTKDTISQQTAAIEIVENELNQSKRRLQVIEQENNNKVRLVEINTYYGDQYSDYARIMKLIVIFSIPILILTILANKGIIPTTVYRVIIAIIVAAAVIYIGKQVITIYSRDRMNYSQFDWNTSRSKLPVVSTDNPEGENPWDASEFLCSAGECCPANYSYSLVENKCVLSELLNESTTTGTNSSLDEFMKRGEGSLDGARQMGGFGAL
jgi:hypothetical protein